MLRSVGIRAGLLAALCMVILVPAALAVTFGGDESYLLPAGETVEGNLYAAGETVRIEGTVTGDLIAAGQTVEVGSTGQIGGDVMAAGQAVIVNGKVDGDIRAAGYMVQVGNETTAATVGGELMAAGYSVGLGKGSTLGDDFTAAGYQGLLDGTVAGDARFGGAALSLEGKIGGDLDASVGGDGASGPPPSMFGPLPTLPRSASPGFMASNDAKVDGQIRYTAPAEASLPASVSASAPQFTLEKTEPEDGEGTANKPAPSPVLSWLTHWLKEAIALLLVGLLLLWLIPRALQTGGEILSLSALPSAGWGCLTLVGAAVGLIALVVATIFGLVVVGMLHVDPLFGPLLSLSFILGSLLTFGVGLLSWAARVVVALWIGRWLLGRFSPGMAINRWAPLIVGVLVYAFLSTLPVLGGLFDLIGQLLGIGALILQTRRYWPNNQPTPIGTPSEPGEPMVAGA